MTNIDFPEHAMSGIALRYANVMSQYFESPKEFWYFAFLTCLGHLLADKVVLDGSLETQPRLYCVMLGSSGMSHKSWAGEYTYKFFRKMFEHDFPICTGVNSDSGLKNVMDKQPRTLLWFDEFQTFIKKASISGSTLLQIVNELYESNRSETNKAQESMIIEPGHLSLMAACTKETYEKIYTPEFIDIGFPNRLFIVPAERSRKVPRPRNIPDDQLDPIREKLSVIHTLAKQGKTITMTINADAVYDEWYYSLPQSDYVSRLDGYAQRLIILTAVSDGRWQADDGITRRVAEMCNWQLMMRRTYAPYDADTMLAQLEQRIVRRLTMHGAHTERKLSQYIKANRYGYGLFGKAINNLIEHDVIGRVKHDKTPMLQIIAQELD